MSFFKKRLRFKLRLMKLKGCVFLLNILREYSNIMFPLRGRSGSIKMRKHANKGEGGYVNANFNTEKGGGSGSYACANVHTYFFIKFSFLFLSYLQ